MQFFVAGMSGHVGGAAARTLLAQEHKLRTLARDPGKLNEWSQKGVDVRDGDLTDSAALAKALDGVDGAFLLIPPLLVPSPGYPEAKKAIRSYLEALHQTPPPRLVALSSVGSEQSSGLGNITTTHLMEEAFHALPMPVAFVRAGSFFENYVAALGPAEATGIFFSFFQPTDRAFPMVATADIGAEVARLLTSEWSGQKIVELGSKITPDDFAGQIGEAIGKPVKAQAIPRGHWASTLETFGMQPGHTGLYEEMMEGFNSGRIDFGVAGAERVEGTVTPAEFFRQIKKAV